MSKSSLASVILFSLALVSICPQAKVAAQTGQLNHGDQAPDFSLPYATRDSISVEDVGLSSYQGVRNVVIAFYPADWSGGCTREVCTLRDNFAQLSQLDAEILAISGDYVYSHQQWAKELNLPFKLLSDHSHKVAKLYGSFNDNSGFNKRTVFIVDKNGKIAYADLEYNTKDATSFDKLREALAKVK